ncbi:hypothetical protein SAMD00019534_062720 [Acytostelium subglobosum LB1]|uniref:hypothetical protein n=1 Tax=Acytostelium subglobosum LB1 TaxID=1410327 RepID=UPI00064501E4|nr:hypothetical protein SAMD00019534_062720 [Acytostelium subglobosum LB1]GAM23097.1 hypothetical protein SAMD00019534_062720 [Acytostelium subglobosum LB1]|eukprot:XP_012754324.1 hypothetical protein SAMD00019534_062720 [Acytostelium subglobosum LB1]
MAIPLFLINDTFEMAALRLQVRDSIFLTKAQIVFCAQDLSISCYIKNIGDTGVISLIRSMIDGYIEVPLFDNVFQSIVKKCALSTLLLTPFKIDLVADVTNFGKSNGGAFVFDQISVQTLIMSMVPEFVYQLKVTFVNRSFVLYTSKEDE